MAGTREAGAGLKEWAAEELGVEAHAEAGEVRAAFLRKVAEEEFVPPADWRRAYGVLRGGAGAVGGGGGRPSCPSARAWAEGRRSEEVEGFILEFFELAPAERRGRWQELLARCEGSPTLAAWLRALEPGLGVEETAVLRLPCPARQLAAFLYPLFLLRPVRRAVLRQEFRQSILANPEWKPAEWRSAAKYLRRRHPDLAALDPEMLQPPSVPVRTRRYRGTAFRSAKPGWGLYGAFAIFIACFIVVIGAIDESRRPPGTYSLATRPAQEQGSDRGVQPAFNWTLLRYQQFVQVRAVLADFEKQGLIDEKKKAELLWEARLTYPFVSAEIRKEPGKYHRAFMQMYLDRVQERELVDARVMRKLQGYLLNEQQHDSRVGPSS